MNLFDVGSVSLIAIIVGDTTAHEVRQRARCHNCGVKGNNTYQIVYARVALALRGMALVFSRESQFAKPSIGEGGAKNSRRFIVICPALTFFMEKV